MTDFESGSDSEVTQLDELIEEDEEFKLCLDKKIIKNNTLKFLFVMVLGLYIISLWTQLGDLFIQTYVIKERFGIKTLFVTSIILTLILFVVVHKFDIPFLIFW